MDDLVLSLLEWERRRMGRLRLVAYANAVAMTLTLAASLLHVLPRPLLLALNAAGTLCALLSMRAAWHARRRVARLAAVPPLHALRLCGVELEPGVRLLGVERPDGDTITLRLSVDGRRGTGQLTKRDGPAVSYSDAAFDDLERQLRASVSPDPN